MRFICDGHEYTVIEEDAPGYPACGFYTIKNNYGSPVATLSLSLEYWVVDLIGGERIASWHENDVIDNLLEERAVQAYVAWAYDNDTVEEH